MKKYFSNILALAALLMAGAAFTACSSEDNIEQPASPVGEKTYTLTINASKGANASTRALALDGTKLVASWENGDVLTVYNKTKGAALTGTLTAKNANGGTATFSGSLTGTIEVNGVLALSYHQPTGMSDYSAQAGTLASAAARDYAIAQVTVASVEDGNITTTDDASFQTQTAMLKLTLEDGDNNKLNATQLKVSATITIGSTPLTEDIATFNLSAATYTANGDGILYFALPDQATVAGALVTKIQVMVPSVTTDAVKIALGGATLTYTATVGGNTYTATKTGYAFAAGKYYAGTLTMTKLTLAQTMTTAGMTVKVKYNYADEENYCLFSSNGNGTYTFQSGGGDVGGNDGCAKDLVIEGGKLVFKQNFYEPIDDLWSDYGFSATFDTSNNTYSQWVGQAAQQQFNPSFISVEVNSVPIALTQKITVADLDKQDGQFWSDIIANNSDKIKADGDYVVRKSDNAKLQYNPFSSVWQYVRTNHDYKTMETYKFEGD